MAQIRDGMTTDLVTVEPSTGVVEAAQRMIEQKRDRFRWWRASGSSAW